MERTGQRVQHGNSDPLYVLLGLGSLGVRLGATAARPPIGAGLLAARIARRLPIVDAVATILAVEGHRAQHVAASQLRMAGAALADSGIADRIARDLLSSELAVAMVDQVLSSPEMQRTVERFASSPEMRSAIAEQSAGMAKEMVGGVRSASVRLDDASEQRVRRWLRRPQPKTV